MLKSDENNKCYICFTTIKMARRECYHKVSSARWAGRKQVGNRFVSLKMLRWQLPQQDFVVLSPMGSLGQQAAFEEGPERVEGPSGCTFPCVLRVEGEDCSRRNMA
jgi:hypothetical protein